LTSRLLELATFANWPGSRFESAAASAGGLNLTGAACRSATGNCGAGSVNSIGIRVAFMKAD
jgi:hypothetical protein